MASYLSYLKPWFETVHWPFFPPDHPGFGSVTWISGYLVPGVARGRRGRDSHSIVTETELGGGCTWWTGGGSALTAWEIFCKSKFCVNLNLIWVIYLRPSEVVQTDSEKSPKSVLQILLSLRLPLSPYTLLCAATVLCLHCRGVVLVLWDIVIVISIVMVFSLVIWSKHLVCGGEGGIIGPGTEPQRKDVDKNMFGQLHQYCYTC